MGSNPILSATPALIPLEFSMPNTKNIAIIAHLMRRAGFGASWDELETLAEQGYEATVEQLLHPEEQPDIDEYELYRYLPMVERSQGVYHAQMAWLYRMANGNRPLLEKMALFWHHVFATGNDKVASAYDMDAQIDLFRARGMGSYQTLLTELARDPAMIFWLDNQENHRTAPNENWGRELLELFSIGVGSYTERDVFDGSRAFTGWTIGPKIPNAPYGPFRWPFEYRPQDHDNGEKTFLGHAGALNGEDVIDIIVRQPACAGFIARHLYNFFVADEPEVPKWPSEPPQDPDAVRAIAETFVASDYEIKPVLRMLFSSDFFKEAAFRKVKNPAEVIVGALKLTGDLRGPDPAWGFEVASAPGSMGQDLLNPPSVEGWHTGREWVNSGALINRVNFVADRVGNVGLPGVQAIVERLGSNGNTMTPEALVDGCLEQMGPMEVEKQTLDELVAHANKSGPISSEDKTDFGRRVGQVLSLIAGTKEYQFG